MAANMDIESDSDKEGVVMGMRAIRAMSLELLDRQIGQRSM